MPLRSGGNLCVVREQRLLEGGDVAVEPRAELGHPRGRRDAFLDGLATGARRSRGADQVEAGRALAAGRLGDGAGPPVYHHEDRAADDERVGR